MIEKPRPRRWPVFVVLALFALSGYGIWKRQRPPEPAPAAAAPAAATQSAFADNSQRLKQEIEREFKSADTNGDGYLSPDEMRAHFPFLAREFSRVDKDGDGRISQQEFMQAKRIMLERRLQKQN